MWKDKDLTERVNFENVALEFYETHDKIIDLYDEMIKLFKLPHIGGIVLTAYKENVEKYFKAAYYIIRDGHSFEEVFRVVNKTKGIKEQIKIHKEAA